MFSDDLSQLLSAYVDGELTARQQEAILKLLRKSATARSMLQQMQADAARLRSLPRHEPANDFAKSILAALSATPSPRRVAARPAAERSLSPWIGLPAAAAVLLAVFFGSYRYFSVEREALPPSQPVAAAAKDSERVASADTLVNPSVADNKIGNAPATDLPERSPPDRNAAKAPALKAAAPASATQPRIPPKKELDGVFTTPAAKQEMFELVDPTNSLALSVRELAQKSMQQRLRAAFKPGEAYRLELTGSANAKAVEALTKAIQSQGMLVLVDDAALQRAKHPKWMTDYAVLAEDVTPDELVNLFTRLGRAERDADVKRADAARFHDLVVLPLSAEDNKEAGKLLGIESSLLTVPNKSAGVAVSSPQALLFVYNPPRSQPSSSKEIKRFLEARTQKRPGAVHILLVMRAVVL